MAESAEKSVIAEIAKERRTAEGDGWPRAERGVDRKEGKKTSARECRWRSFSRLPLDPVAGLGRRPPVVSAISAPPLFSAMRRSPRSPPPLRSVAIDE